MNDPTNAGEEYHRARKFLITLYGAPGVSAACLRLQDRLSVNVVVLLFGAYVGAEARIVLSPAQIREIADAVARWHDEVVAPLRAVRRAVKGGLQGAPASLIGELKQKVQAAELMAEFMELWKLNELVRPWIRGDGADDDDGPIEANLLGIATIGSRGRPEQEDESDLKTIAAACQLITRSQRSGDGSRPLM